MAPWPNANAPNMKMGLLLQGEHLKSRTASEEAAAQLLSCT